MAAPVVGVVPLPTVEPVVLGVTDPLTVVVPVVMGEAVTAPVVVELVDVAGAVTVPVRVEGVVVTALVVPDSVDVTVPPADAPVVATVVVPVVLTTCPRISPAGNAAEVTS